MLTIDMLPQQLKSALDCDDTAQLRTVNESLINETYCLSSYDQRFLVKRFLADQSTGRSRKLLFEIQKKLAKCGLAPEPLFLCKETGFYAEEWITPCLTPLNVLDESNRMTHLAQALIAIHRLPISTNRMDLPAQWKAYLDAANLEPNDIRLKSATELVFLAASSVNSLEDLVFCHNDLAFNHVINYEDLKIIDWEYCSTGNRYFDIASTIAINRLSAVQRDLLIADYAKAFDLSPQAVLQGVYRHEPLVTLTYQLWYAAITEHVKHSQ